MTVYRRCDHQGCDVSRQDVGPGVNAYMTSVALGPTTAIDLCDDCLKILKRWLDGDAQFVTTKASAVL